MSVKIFERTDSSGLVTTAVFRAGSARRGRALLRPAGRRGRRHGRRRRRRHGRGGTQRRPAPPPRTRVTTGQPGWPPPRITGSEPASSCRLRDRHAHQFGSHASAGAVEHPEIHEGDERARGPSEGHCGRSVRLHHARWRLPRNWPPGPGNLATGSFPGDIENTSEWSARSKDHIAASPCTIDVWSVAIPEVLTFGGGIHPVDRRIERLGRVPNWSRIRPPRPRSKVLHGPTGIGATSRSRSPASCSGGSS